MIGKQDDSSEHQVVNHFVAPFDDDIAGSEVFFQPTVRPLRKRFNLVALCFVRAMEYDLLATSVSVSIRDMGKLSGGRVNEFAVVSTLHQIVEVG